LRRLGTAVIGILLFVSFATAQETPAYKNPKLPVEMRVSDLVQRMTLEEKVAQLGSFWPNEKFIPGVYLPFDPKTRKFNPSTAEKLLKLMEALEEHDDVSKVFSNFDIDAETMAAVSG